MPTHQDSWPEHAGAGVIPWNNNASKITYLVGEKHDLENTQPKLAGNGFFQTCGVKIFPSPHPLVKTEALRNTLKSAVCTFTNSLPIVFFHGGNCKVDFTRIVSIRHKTLVEWPAAIFVQNIAGIMCAKFWILYWCSQSLSSQPSLEFLPETACNATNPVKQLMK